MPLNFNLSPYYDDFDETKNYHRILFKPGYAVQARELTQLQTQLQSQITRFGNHIFKEGSVVLGGNFFNIPVHFVDVSRNNNISLLEDQHFTGQTSGAKGKIVKTRQISDEIARVYFSYTNGMVFERNESIVCDNGNVENIIDNATFSGTATLFSIDSSVFYIFGNFVHCNPQNIVIGEDENPTCRVGLQAEEIIVDYSNDTTLLDPALGSYNFSAPGADRYSISLNLLAKEIETVGEEEVAASEEGFIELVRIVNGTITKQNKLPIYSEIEKTLARRTYDESGDYTVKAFGIKVIDHIGSNTDLLTLQIEPGKAYVKGYEFETTSSTFLDLPKSRSVNFENEFPLYVNYGKYFYIQDPSKSVLDYTANPTVNVINGNTSSSMVIGNCRVKGIEFDSTVGPSSVYKMYVDNLQLRTGESVSNIASFNLATFRANIASSQYSTVSLEGSDESTYIIEIPKQYVQTIDSSETSYEAFVKVPDNASFISNGSFAVATLDNNGPSNQVFLGSGLLSQSDTNRLYTFVVASTTNSGVLPVGTVVSYANHQLRVNVLDENTLQISTNVAFNFTATLFTNMFVSSATRKTKTVQSGSLSLTGASLTAANLSGQISLGKSDCIELSSVTANTDTGTVLDYTTHYLFNNGQTDVLYDHGYITLKPGYVSPAADNKGNVVAVNITFSYYSHVGTSSGFFNVDSYPNYENIPSYTSSTGKTYNLRDCFDFRPRRVDNSTSISGLYMAVPSSIITTDFTYYLGRIDRLAITKEKKFTLIKGVPSVTPTTPTDIQDSMGLYIIDIPPYTQSKDNVTFKFIENKRYTMRDIGKIEKRVEKLEYYTSLSLLEKQAADEAIPSDIPTIDRFKNGILVDSFAGHSIGDVAKPDYRCSIDYEKRILRPSFSSKAHNFVFSSGSNHSIRNNVITLDYSLEPLIAQPLASDYVNVTPYNVFVWNGTLTIDPPSDNWTDTTKKPDVIVNLNGENDPFTQFVSNVNNPASVGLKWSEWQVSGKGTPVINDKSTSSSATTYTSATTGVVTNTTYIDRTTTTTDTLSRVGLEVSTGEIQTITKDIGTKVVDVSLAPYIRSRIINFHAKSLKPLTNVFAVFDEVDVSAYCFPATEIILSSNTVNMNATSITKVSAPSVVGNIIGRRANRIYVNEDGGLFFNGDSFNWIVNGTPSGTDTVNMVVRRSKLVTNDIGDIAGRFSIPNSESLRFRVGEKEFKIADIPTGTATTAAATKYVAQGLSQSTENTYISTRVATVSVNPVLQTTTKTTVNKSYIVNKVSTDIRTSPCGQNENGGVQGTFEYNLDFSFATGVCGITFDSDGFIPDRYTIVWDGKVYSTGFVGSSYFNSRLNGFGYPSVSGPATGQLLFNKTKSEPTTARLIVEAPISGTSWRYRIVCPGATPIPPTKNTSIAGSYDTSMVGQVTFTYDHAPRVILSRGNRRWFEWDRIDVPGIETITVPVTLYFYSVGTNAPYIRVSGLSCGGGGTLSSSVVDFITYPAPNGIPGHRYGTGVVYLTVNRPANGAGYWIGVYGTSTLYSNPERTNLTEIAPIYDEVYTYVYRNDAIGRPIPPPDPVAQTFFIDENVYPDGVFLDSIDLFFKKKSENIPVYIEIRPVVNGYPSSRDIVPFSSVDIEAGEVKVSSDASEQTRFRFDAPVYLTPGEHCFVIRTNSTEYELFTGILGNTLVNNPDVRITEQPSVGSMFKSQNSSTWTPVQEEDLAFIINKCAFLEGEANTSTVFLNSDYSEIGDFDYDLLFADGESLGFSDTISSYSYKSTNEAGDLDPVFTPYQAGTNLPMTSRRILRSGSGGDLQFKVDMITYNKDLSPVVDLTRFTAVTVRNYINNGGLSKENFLLTGYGEGYVANANVIISAATGSGATAFAEYVPETDKLEVVVTNPGSGYTGEISAIIDRSAGATANATVIVQNEVNTEVGNALGRYVTRKVTLAPGFESTDLKAYILANIPSNTSLKMFYKVAPIGTVVFENEIWREMELESSGVPSETGFVEYKYKTPGDTALPSGDRFQTFSVKIVMYSSNSVRVPQIKDLRVIALDE